MANTPNMTLEIGVPGSTVGPDWAELIERNKDDIDAHDHTSTKGVKVPSAGINHNDEEDFGDHGILNARVVQLASRSSTPSDNAVLYRDSSGDLFWRTSGGANVQITSGSSIAASTLSNGFWQTEEKSASFSLTGANKTLLRVNTAATGRVITLPAANTVTAGQYWIVVDSGGGANTITFTPAGSDKINGQNASFVAKAVGGVLILTNLDQTDDWSVTSTISGTINSSSVATGYTLRRSSATAQTYEFAAFDLSGSSNAITGRVPSANLFLATGGEEGAVRLANDLSGTSSAPTVAAITGDGVNTCVIRDTARNMLWAATTLAPKLGVSQHASGAGVTLAIQGQAAGGSGADGGAVVVTGGAPSGAGTNNYGAVALQSSNSVMGVTNLGTSQRSVALLFANPSATDVPSGDKVLYIGNAGTSPTSAPVGGALLFSESGKLVHFGDGLATIGTSSVLGGTLSLFDLNRTNATTLSSNYLQFHPSTSALEFYISPVDRPSAGNGLPMRIQSQRGSGASGNGGDIEVRGGIRGGASATDGGVKLTMGDGEVALYSYSPSAGRTLLSVFNNGSGSSIYSGLADNIAIIGNAATNPTTDPTSGGFLLYGSGGYPTFRTVGGRVGLVGGLYGTGPIVNYSSTGYASYFYMKIVIDGTTYRMPLFGDA